MQLVRKKQSIRCIIVYKHKFKAKQKVACTYIESIKEIIPLVFILHE